MTHQNDIKKLITDNKRRLQKLKEKEAIYGINTPAEILIEIENIEAKLKQLQALLPSESAQIEPDFQQHTESQVSDDLDSIAEQDEPKAALASASTQMEPEPQYHLELPQTPVNSASENKKLDKPKPQEPKKTWKIEEVNSENQPVPQFKLVFISSVIALLVGIAANLIASWLWEDIFGRFFSPIVVVTLVLFMIAGVGIGVWLNRHPKFISVKKVIYWVIVFFIISVILWIVVGAWFMALLNPGTTYFVVDGTEKMKPFYPDMQKEVMSIVYDANFATGGSSWLISANRLHFGLRAYGGQGARQFQCYNTRQLLEPTSGDDLPQQLNTALASFEPGGKGSLTLAVLDTITKDLTENGTETKLFIVTAGIDPECDQMESEVLERITKELRPGIKMAIISIGNITGREKDIFDQYAQAFGGYHRNAESLSELPEIVEEDRTYRLNYSYYYYYANNDGTDP